MGFEERYEDYRRKVEGRLAELFREDGRLYEAMRYSLLAGGKRIRPVLGLASCELFGGAAEDALPFACAVELVHTYSLIHDDLPCMDDDDTRRGKPSCHIAYGEAAAVLAGDALQAEAFRLIAEAPGLDGGCKVEAVRVLALACGAEGMVGGQMLDLEGGWGCREELARLHRLKTGAMIRAAAELGAVAAGAEPERREMVGEYASHLGLAFQVRDDILDAAGEAHERNFVDLLGLEGCEALAAQETALAKAALEGIEGREFLCALADKLLHRRQ